MGEKSDRLSGADPVEQYPQNDVPANMTSGLIAPGSAFSGNVAPAAPYNEGDPELYSNEFAAGAPSSDFEADDSDDEIGQTRAQIEQTRAEMSTTIDAIQEKLSPQHIAQQAKDTVRDAKVGKAQEMVSNAGDTASELMSNAGSSARGFGATLIETVRKNPLAVGVAAIAVGAAIGLSIPETEKENQLMGETRDNLVRQAEQTAQDKVQQVQTVAQQAVGAAKDAAPQSAERQGLTQQ
jgi:ElaB/YqjD/DUF883 family membrane-anchored ribosome-binding protein